MKKLVCEMCGGTDLIKQDGVFVCQSCGLKYSLEEARKMMVEVEGTVTVKVDETEKATKLLLLARRARESEDYETALRYYTEVVEVFPNSWEAVFYSNYYSAMNTSLGRVAISTQSLTKKLAVVLTLIKQSSEDPKDICIQLAQDINKMITLFDNAVMRSELYERISDDFFYTAAEIYNQFGDMLVDVFQEYELAYAVFNCAYGAYPYDFGEETKFKSIEQKLGKSRAELLATIKKYNLKGKF